MMLLFIALDIGDLLVEQLAIAPLIAAGVAALGTTVLNNVLNRDNMDYKQDLSKDMMQYQWNKYNSPAALVREYAKAGISPSVAMGNQGVGGNIAMPSPSPVSDSPYLVSGVDSFANAVRAIAESKKVGAETVGQTLENDLLRQTFDDKVEAVALQNHWTKEQTAKTTQEVGLLSGQFNELQQRIENMRSEKRLTDKNVEWYDRHMKAEISHIKNSAEYQKALAGLTQTQKELLDATFDDLTKITNLNMQQLEKVVGLLDKYSDAQAIVGMISQIVGSASQLVGSIADFKNVPLKK